MWVGAVHAQAIDVTLLETVNLPWQDPEVIVAARQRLTEVVVDVESDGTRRTERWAALEPGQSRSLLWSAGPGAHTAKVSIQGVVGGTPFSQTLTGTVTVREPLRVAFGADDVDLVDRKLTLRASEPIQQVELSLYDVDGHLMEQAGIAQDGKERSAVLTLPETPSHIARIALRVFASDDTWADVAWEPIQIELSPPALTFDGEGVGVALGDRPKLDAIVEEARAAAKAHGSVKGLKLYVLGASGDLAAKGRTEQRAGSVARYVKQKGVRLPVAVGTVVDPGFEGIEYIIASQPPVETEFRPVR